ncbi:MAG TPA: septum formation initiator family protein [Gaiellaceae bacterium]|nr:septum formation initiator family protein [Gaiellaceae bacterium]
MARRKPSRSRIALRWAGAAVLLLIALSYIHPLSSYRHARDEVAARKAAIAALERDNEELTRKLLFASKDEFVEREARRLGLVRRGEHLFIVKGLGSPETRPVR